MYREFDRRPTAMLLFGTVPVPARYLFISVSEEIIRNRKLRSDSEVRGKANCNVTLKIVGLVVKSV